MFAPLASASPVALPEQQVVTPAMGEVAVVLVGITSPVADRVPLRMYLVLDDEDDLGPSVLMLRERLATASSPVSGRLYADVLGPVDVAGLGSVVMITAAEPATDLAWLTMISDRDFAFATWVPD